MRQWLQSADDGSRAGENESRVHNNGSLAGVDGLCADAYVYARMHSYASIVYKGGEVSFRHMALFLLFLLLNISGRATTFTRPPLCSTMSVGDHLCTRLRLHETT